MSLARSSGSAILRSRYDRASSVCIVVCSDVACEVGALVGPPDLPAVQPRRARHAREAALLLGRERLVDPRRDPDRRALEHGEVLDLGRDRGHVLDRARAGADRRDPLAGERLAVIPARRVERAAAEAVGAGDVGHDRNVEHAEPAHDDVGGERLAGRGRRAPSAARSSFQRASVIAAPVRTCGRTPYWSVQRSR